MNNFQHNQTHSQNQDTTQNTTNFPPNNSFSQPANNQVNQTPSVMTKLLNSCLPVLLEQFTGQSMMPMGGNNNAELQLLLPQVINTLQQIATSQQDLVRRIGNLETRASQQFTGLAQQIQNFKSVRLTRDRERKQIELGTNQSDFDKSRHFNQNTDNYEN